MTKATYSFIISYLGFWFQRARIYTTELGEQAAGIVARAEAEILQMKPQAGNRDRILGNV